MEEERASPVLPLKKKGRRCVVLLDANLLNFNTIDHLTVVDPDICAAYTARPTICRTAASCPRAGPPHRGTAERNAPRLPRYVDTNAAVSEDMLRTKHCNPIEHRATELVVMCLAAAAPPLSTECACGAVS
jgi:hypothetical protein